MTWDARKASTEIRDAEARANVKNAAWALLSRARVGGVPDDFVEPENIPEGASCFPSIPQLARDTGLSPRAAAAARRHLERHGIGALRVVVMKHPNPRGGQPINVYRLTLQHAQDAACKEQGEQVATSTNMHEVPPQDARGAACNMHEVQQKDLNLRSKPKERVARATPAPAPAPPEVDPRAQAIADELERHELTRTLFPKPLEWATKAISALTAAETPDDCAQAVRQRLPRLVGKPIVIRRREIENAIGYLSANKREDRARQRTRRGPRVQSSGETVDQLDAMAGATRCA